jgi:nitrite reductase/ring-hydroxylating ferredoxin subunit
MNDVLARLDAMPEGQPVEVEAALAGAPESLILVREGDRVVGYFNICPHAGRRLDWAPGKFLLSREGHLVCAAHGASFELPSGTCVAGPCRGDALRQVALTTEGGDVRLADPAAGPAGGDTPPLA